MRLVARVLDGFSIGIVGVSVVVRLIGIGAYVYRVVYYGIGLYIGAVVGAL